MSADDDPPGSLCRLTFSPREWNRPCGCTGASPQGRLSPSSTAFELRPPFLDISIIYHHKGEQRQATSHQTTTVCAFITPKENHGSL